MIKTKHLVGFITFIIAWQFFHYSIDFLRFDPRVFWPLILFILLAIVVHVDKQIKINKYFILLVLILLYSSIISIFSIDVGYSEYSILLMMIYFLVGFLLTKVIDTNLFYRFTFIFTCLHLFYIFLQLIVPDVFYNIFSIMDVPTSIDAYNNAINGAYRGFTGQTSISAFYLSLGFLVCLSSLSFTKKKHLLFIVLTILFFIAIALTNRRGTFVVISILTSLYIYLLKSRRIKIIIILSIAFFLIIFGYQSIPGLDSIVDKFRVYISANNITSGRMELWKNAINQFKMKPIFGSGWLSYNIIYNVSSAHNSYLQLLSDLGLIGFVLFFLPFTYGFVITMRLFMKTRIKVIDNQDFIVFSFFIQLFFFLSSLFEGYFQEEVLLLLLVIVQLQTININNKVMYNEKKEYI